MWHMDGMQAIPPIPPPVGIFIWTIFKDTPPVSAEE